MVMREVMEIVVDVEVKVVVIMIMTMSSGLSGEGKMGLRWEERSYGRPG
jgi:hypothetical protein